MTAYRVFHRGVRAGIASLPTGNFAFPQHQLRHSSSTPATVFDTSFWKSLVPKPLRRENRQAGKAVKSREWNPATYFIVMFLFIGSMSIQMIALRNQFDRYMRQSEVRIGLLREVVQKIQNGEKVDVEKTLGTGDAQKEADWEEVLQAIQRDETARKAQKQERSRAVEAQAEPATEAETKVQRVEPANEPAQTRKGGLGNFF
ncbi:hypothetical protein S7711_03046 [Stachybotrys chartarum IBT 7711]|uniref:Uncharacterized protein n=1 Tax=Stachybotrys chartarum (strain CBS 109288 / IBT 7711) TaxID=1280523 RepID=A0A084APF7_STACB|nr:hypothetical protein S7711_03046 [Stachybotrys chartarum IBT 7711]KFA46750.1 hypothetical protein S40293_08133 [Stachybotrys chartarum IBT 40293]KFA75165.1 hypothetical protein S40288_02865 [Stachybotrys chartarum IBT 40288]